MYLVRFQNKNNSHEVYQLENCKEIQAFSRNDFVKFPLKVGVSIRSFFSQIVRSVYVWHHHQSCYLGARLPVWSENNIDCCSYFECFSFISSAPKVVKSDPFTCYWGFYWLSILSYKKQTLIGSSCRQWVSGSVSCWVANFVPIFREFCLTG